jgi:ankyrin repeat protein
MRGRNAILHASGVRQAIILITGRYEMDRYHEALLKATYEDDARSVEELLSRGADPNARDRETGLTALIIAAGHGKAEIVWKLLGAGADPFAVESRGGCSALHKAIQGGSLEIVRMLVEAGAFIDWPAPTTGHTPLMDALWYKRPDIVQYLLDHGAGMNLHTRYGFSLREHFQYELNVTVIDKDKLTEADHMMRARTRTDQEAVCAQKLMAAVT